MTVSRRLLYVPAILIAFAGLSLAVAAAPSVRLKDADNHVVDPFQTPAGVKAIVFLFVSVDCPVSNRYAPLVKGLDETFGPKGVQFWLVYPNPFDTPALIQQHRKAFSYPMGALLDPEHALAKLAKASVTPEAAVFDRQGREVYHGRIDDKYVDISRERPSPTQHDLNDALAATLAGKPVAHAETQAVGCFISDFVK
jgi:hypothetical protein